jgi:predicted secreted protein
MRQAVAWTTMLAIYFIIWWLVFFTVLPFGIRSQHEHGEIVPGTDPGAPSVHGLKTKAIWTTAVASVVFGLFYWASVTKAVALDDLVTLWGLLRPSSRMP